MYCASNELHIIYDKIDCKTMDIILDMIVIYSL